MNRGIQASRTAHGLDKQGHLGFLHACVPGGQGGRSGDQVRHLGLCACVPRGQGGQSGD